MNRKILLCTAAVLIANVALAQPEGGVKVSPQAHAVHEAAIILDTHMDTPALFSDPAGTSQTVMRSRRMAARWICHV